jgi:hypothetical protein
MSRSKLLVAGSAILLLAATVLYWRAPPSPHGAFLSIFASSDPVPSSRLKVQAVANHAVPSSVGYRYLRADAFFRPDPPQPVDLVVEIIGGARLDIGGHRVTVPMSEELHRDMLTLPSLPEGAGLTMEYVPAHAPPFFRILSWDRIARTLGPLPERWLYARKELVGQTDRTRRLLLAMAVAAATGALVLFGLALPRFRATSSITFGPGLIALPLLALLYAGMIAGRFYYGETLLRRDAPALLAATRSLAEDGDLDLHGQSDLDRYEHPASKTYCSEFESIVALGTNGSFYPKHPWIFAVLSAPLYALAGIWGPLLLNAVALLLLAWTMYLTCCAVGVDARVSAALMVLIGASPMLLEFAYNISVDALGSAVGMAGLAAVMLQWPLVGGLLLGVSLLVRLTYGWLAVAAVFVIASRSQAVRLCLGLLAPIAVLLAMNWRMFGGPLEMSYNHVLVIVNGERATGTHADLFDRDLVTGIVDQMLQIKLPGGLIVTAPLAVLAWLGIIPLARRSGRLALGWMLASAGLYLTFARYVYTSFGNYVGYRFLIPIIGLAALPLACLFEAVVTRRSTAAAPSEIQETQPTTEH